MHLDGFHLSGESDGSEADDHTGLDDSGLDTSHGNRSNTTNLVNILKGQTKGQLGRSLRLGDVVEGFCQELDGGLLGLLLGAGDDIGSGEPLHGDNGLFDHVVSVESRNGDEGDTGQLEANLLQVVSDFLLDLLESLLVVRGSGGVHLVHGNDDLSDSKGEGEEQMLSGLSVGSDSSLELSGSSSNNEDSSIGLRGATRLIIRLQNGVYKS